MQPAHISIGEGWSRIQTVVPLAERGEEEKGLFVVIDRRL